MANRRLPPTWIHKQQGIINPKAIVFTRTALGLSQEEFAKRIGVSRRTISVWENGKESPRKSNLPALIYQITRVRERMAQRRLAPPGWWIAEQRALAREEGRIYEPDPTDHRTTRRVKQRYTPRKR